MPSLPIPLISSLVLGFLLVRMLIIDRRYGPLALLLALCAVQGVIISMAQHYGVPGFRVVQAITATLIPPMAWVAFQVTAVRRLRPQDAAHLGGPLLAILCLATQPTWLDWVIPGLFVGYGIAIIRQGWRGADALPRARIEAGDLPGQIWRVIGAALLLSAMSDVLIVAAQFAGAAYLQPWIISIYSSLMLLVVGTLSLSQALISDDEAPEDAPQAPEITDEDKAIVARLDALMASDQPYLNPDLTLSQLSRKLRVPVKQLSGAINRVTGENVSRYINAARITAAQTALRDGENVTQAMFSAGFNTKSNFNREFLRVTGKSPSDWLSTG